MHQPAAFVCTEWKFHFVELPRFADHCEDSILGDPTKAHGLCGEMKNQDTAGIFRLRKI